MNGSRVVVNAFCNVRTGNKTKAYKHGSLNPPPDITLPFPPKVLSAETARQLAAALIEAAEFVEGIERQ